MSFFPPKTLELTLALFKPSLVKLPHAVQTLREDILQKGFLIVSSKRCMLTPDQVKCFYKEHEGKGFYTGLVTFMMSGPVDAYILAREDGIKYWREMMGPTMTTKAQYTHSHSVRGRYGLSDTRNASHGSDSVDSFLRESGIVFPEFSMEKWYEAEEIHFRNGFAKFNEDKYIHCSSEASPFIRP